jgi:hypothetical protein
VSSILQSTKLFGRSYKLTLSFLSPAQQESNVIAVFVGSTASPATQAYDVSTHDIEFVVEKSLKPGEPNTCSIKVFNLSATQRQNLSGFNVYNPGSPATGMTVLLEAGYQQQTSQIYFAGARGAWSTRVGADYVTHIESMDTIARPTGLKKTKKIPPGGPPAGSVYHTTGAKVPLSQALNALAEAMGVGPGNLGDLARILASPSQSGFPVPTLTSVNGSAIVGNSARRMTDICRSAGLEWSVQDGVLQILNVGQTLSTTTAIELNSSSGLIGSPNVDSQGALELTTLLTPGLAPGILIDVESEFVTGGYRIEKIRYEGNTRGQAWYAHIAASKY